MKKLAISFLFVLSGCGLMPHEALQLYEGEVKPLSEIASVAEGQRAFAYITKIDEKRIGGARHTKGVHINPGTHTFHWKYVAITDIRANTLYTKNAQGQFKATVEKGHSYIPIFEPTVDGEGLYVYLIDKGKDYNQECLKDIVLSGGEFAEGC